MMKKNILLMVIYAIFCLQINLSLGDCTKEERHALKKAGHSKSKIDKICKEKNNWISPIKTKCPECGGSGISKIQCRFEDKWTAFLGAIDCHIFCNGGILRLAKGDPNKCSRNGLKAGGKCGACDGKGFMRCGKCGGTGYVLVQQ